MMSTLLIISTKILAAFSFALGAVIASFLNVVIYRVPKGESIVLPPSHCPKCQARIKWYQNIPILSWLYLRGKCANCKEPISPRYILIEALGGVLFAAIFLKYGVSVFTPILWIWTALMIVGTMIDFDHKLLPDFVTVGGMILGAFAATLYTGLYLTLTPLFNAFTGLLAGFGGTWLIRFLGTKAFKREAMGMGDVFLMGAIGTMFGPTAVLFTLIVSSLLGSVVGVTLIALSKTKFGKFYEIPFGPYLALASTIWLFCGAELVHWYLSLLHINL